MELDVGQRRENHRQLRSHTVIFGYGTEEPENPQPKPDLQSVLKVCLNQCGIEYISSNTIVY